MIVTVAERQVGLKWRAVDQVVLDQREQQTAGDRADRCRRQAPPRRPTPWSADNQSTDHQRDRRARNLDADRKSGQRRRRRALRERHRGPRVTTHASATNAGNAPNRSFFTSTSC